MFLFHVAIYAFLAPFFINTGFVPATEERPVARSPITIVTDPSWDVSGKPTQFGEYPRPAERIASATSKLYGGTNKAVVAACNERSKLVSGSMPIWRNHRADSEGEAYHFRKTLALGADPIRKATLHVNCDDVARVYINKRLVSADKRDGKLKDGYDDWFTFRSVSGFMYDRIYTYDVTDYFFTNVTNTIFVEAVSLAFDGSHAYFSAKLVIEFGPMPEPAPPATASAPAKRQPAAEPKADNKPTPATATAAPTPAPAVPRKPTGPVKTVFEAGRDPEIESLTVGSILELGHVYFKVDDHRLDTASFRTLDALAAFLKRHPALKIEVGGHTNLRPSHSYAEELSTKRAKSVVEYLTEKGVDAGQITHKGYGKSQPRVNAVTQEANDANQRVEVKVLEN